MEKICLGWLLVELSHFLIRSRLMKNDLLSSFLLIFQDLQSSESKDPKLTVIGKPCSFGFDFEDLGSVEIISDDF